MSTLFSKILNLHSKSFFHWHPYIRLYKIPMFFVLVVHIFHLWKVNKTMVTLDKQHFLSTYKVRICLSSHKFLHLFFGQKPNHGYFLPTHNYNPKNYTLHKYNCLNQCGEKSFSTIVWFWVYYRCNNWNMTTFYDTWNVWNSMQVLKTTSDFLILSLVNLGVHQWFQRFFNCWTKFYNYNWCCTFYNAIDLSTHLQKISTN